MSNEIPRRMRVDLYTPAEKAIHDAIAEVEKAGAHTRLTDAVILLSQAKDAVADFVDIGTVEGDAFIISKDRMKEDCKKLAQENNISWACLSIYLDEQHDKGITEFRIQVNSDKTFYIHPFGKDGETFDGRI